MNNEPHTNAGQNPQIEPSETENIRILKISNVAKFFLILSIFATGYLLYSGAYLSPANFNNRSGVLYLSTVVLVILYGIVLLASYIYKIQLQRKHSDQYSQYREQTPQIPKLFAVWVLPIASILLVLAAQITVIPKEEPKFNVAVATSEKTSQTGHKVLDSIMVSDNRGTDIPYLIAFTFATAAILLMIGMELSYSAQKHQKGHRWLVLVTTSLILDFASYFILIAGFQSPVLGGRVDEVRALYVFLLGAGSLISSYFTITQARITDEVLDLNMVNGDA